MHVETSASTLLRKGPTGPEPGRNSAMTATTRRVNACPRRPGTHTGMSTQRKIQTLPELVARPDIAFLTVPDVARVLGRDVRFVRKMIECGDLQAKTLAGNILVTRTAILELTDRADEASAASMSNPARERVDA